MGSVKNISGEDLDIPQLGITVPRGKTVEVDDLWLDPGKGGWVWPAANWEVDGGNHEEAHRKHLGEGVEPSELNARHKSRPQHTAADDEEK